MKRKLLLFLSLFILGNEAIAQCDCGDGSDGAFSATTNMTLPGGTYNYTSFYIESGYTVTVTGNQPLVIKCTGKILIDGLLSVNGGDGGSGIPSSSGGAGGIGVAGGYNGADGVYDVAGPLPGATGSGPGAGNPGIVLGGGSGAGFGGLGYDGQPYMTGPFAAGGTNYGDIYFVTIAGGSGGGSGSGGNSCGSGGGGAGGGILVLRTCDSLVVTGSGVISAIGGMGGWDGGGDCGSGGGGSGGSLWLIAKTFIHNGNLQAYGGLGGFSANSPSGDGGQGGVGRIRIDADALYDFGNTSPAAGYTNQLLQSQMTENDPLCNGNTNGSAIASALGGYGPYQYQWTGGPALQAYSGIGGGTYVVTITDANGCTIKDTAVLVNPPLLTSTITSTVETTVSSNDGTATVTATGGTAPYGYLWTPGGGTTNPLTGLDTGVYIVTVTDDNGCTIYDTVHVGQGVPISVTTIIADHGVSIYPNPASDAVTIAFKDNIKSEVMIQLTDNLGRMIVSEKHNTSAIQLNTSSYATGNYMLRISVDGSVKNIPISIVK